VRVLLVLWLLLVRLTRVVMLLGRVVLLRGVEVGRVGVVGVVGRRTMMPSLPSLHPSSQR
jgi:hypothetical protein